MTKIFSYFKLNKKDRINVEEPANAKTWAIHMASEFIGTILISLGLAGISTVASSDGSTVESYFGTDVLVGLYAGFIVVGTLLFIFLRWSVDLNPAVTLYRWFTGRNTSRYAIAKIVIQFIAGIIAGMMIYGMGHAHGTGVANHAINVVKIKGFLAHSTHDTFVAKTITIVAIELLMTMILLFSIFSKSISDKYRDFMIMFVISMAVWAGILTGSAGINPARGLAQQIPGLFWGHAAGDAASASDIGWATLAMEIGTLIAAPVYVLSQGVVEHYVLPAFNKIIFFKNTRKDNMQQPNKK